MSVTEEIARLTKYIKERKLNLPEVVYLSDEGVRQAHKRLDELEATLELEAQAKLKRDAEEAMRISKSSELLQDLNKDISTIIDTFESKFTALHPSHKPRYMEVMKELKKLRR